MAYDLLRRPGPEDVNIFCDLPNRPSKRAETVNQVVTRFLKNEDGASAIEYALVASLIAVAIIGSVSAIGTKLSALYADIAAKIP